MIHILTLGETIEGLDYLDGKGITESNVTIKGFLENPNIDFEYTVESVFKKNSRVINEDDLGLLANKIKVSKILYYSGYIYDGKYCKKYWKSKLK